MSLLTLAQSDPTETRRAIAAFALLAGALVVLVSGVIALVLVLRAYRKRLMRNPDRPTVVVDAWAEAGRRMETDAPPGSSESDDPDGPSNGSDDDDDGEPDTPLVPTGTDDTAMRAPGG